MISQVTFTIEHGETTDPLDAFIGLCSDVVVDIIADNGMTAEVEDYTVVVDINPEDV